MSSTSSSSTVTPPKKRVTPEFAPDKSPSAQYFLDILSPYRQIIGMSLFLFFALESLVALFSYHFYADTDPMLKMMFSQLLAINTTLAGLLHFYPPLYHFYTSMIFVPFKSFWLYFTGLGFILGGLMVAFTKTLVIGAWILVAMFITCFPGNLACVFSSYPRKEVCGGSLLGAIIRLPFQFTFIAWAWWLTSGPVPFSTF